MILGAGGHALSVQALARRCGFDVLGFLDEPGTNVVPASPVLGTDTELLDYRHAFLAIGFAARGLLVRRKQVAELLLHLDLDSPCLIDPSAVVVDDEFTSVGTQVMAGACIQTRSSIGAWCTINTNATLEHGCVLDEHVHVAPGAILCGDVRVGEGTHIGAGAIVLEGRTVGSNCTIGAGAVVTRDVSDGSTVVGIPARCI